MYRRLSSPVMWTHLFIAAGVALWAQTHLLAAALLAASTGCSLLHHAKGEADPFFYRLDVAMATVTLVITLVLVVPVANNQEAISLALIAVVAFFFKDMATVVASPEAYDYWHSLWHVCVGAGQCMMAMIYSSHQWTLQ